MNGGELVAGALAAHGVRAIFTLCGGHISPIVVGARARGLRVVDVRHEASAVFAADALARLTGTPGVAVLTAGPGLTNALTALKNAQLAQSPLVLLAGATATLLRGRGALQDIDQAALLRPHVKSFARAEQVCHLVPAVAAAFRAARRGVPGPAVVECPVDLLYPEVAVRHWYGLQHQPAAPGLGTRLRRWYLEHHLRRLFQPGRPQPDGPASRTPLPVERPEVPRRSVERAASLLARARRPVALLGSQVTLAVEQLDQVRQALETLGIPVFLSGMARGLLGPAHPLWLRHRRGEALRQADWVLLAGLWCDFRLDYGRGIAPGAAVVAANLSRADARRNRRPTVVAPGDPAGFLIRLAGLVGANRQRAWEDWLWALRAGDAEREAELERLAAQETEYLNPLRLCRAIDARLPDDSVVVADGGDFVATASYLIAPRRPLSWLDPGPFGTLGAGAGFALGAKLARPEAEIWLLYGDGSAGFSLAEFDTMVRHGLPVVAVVGNDGAWTQIARAQVALLGDEVGTRLHRSAYHRVVEGFGGAGFCLSRPEEADAVLAEAQATARAGRPVLVNALIGRSDFRAGSLAL